MNSVKQFLNCAVMIALGLIISTQSRAQFSGGPEGGAPVAEHSLLAAEGPVAEVPRPAPQNFCKCVGEADSAAVERIERALRAPLHSQGLDFTEIPLQEVVTTIQDEYGIPIKIDQIHLEEIGLNSDENVNVNLHNISLRSALNLMLRDLQLTYHIQDEVLMITTPQVAEEHLKTCVYDVSSLTGERDSQLDAIIDSIVSCIARDSWAKNGSGEAEIRAVKPGMLVISQTTAVHEQIRNLLEALRQIRAKSAGQQPADAVFGAAALPDEVVTRSYSLQLNPTNDTESLRSQVRDLITQALPQETWTGQLPDGQGVALTVFNDRVVVRQTAEVQQKVEKLLADSGVAKRLTGSSDLGGGGFFAPPGVPANITPNPQPRP